MSMLLYESAQQRDAELQSQSHCVLIFFPPWSRDHLFGLLPEMLCRLLQPTGPERCSVSIWQCNIPHSWTTPLTFPWLMIAQVKRKPSEGKMMRPQIMDTQTQSMDEVHVGNTHFRREKSASNAFQSGTLLFLQLFSQLAHWTEEGRNYNILTQFLRPDKWAKYYHGVNKRINCHWMQCATLPKSLLFSMTQILGSFNTSQFGKWFSQHPFFIFLLFSQLLKHHTDTGEAKVPKADRMLECKCGKAKTGCVFTAFSGVIPDVEGICRKDRKHIM